MAECKQFCMATFNALSVVAACTDVSVNDERSETSLDSTRFHVRAHNAFTVLLCAAFCSFVAASLRASDRPKSAGGAGPPGELVSDYPVALVAVGLQHLGRTERPLSMGDEEVVSAPACEGE
jgi:hypothetical protein